MKVLLFVMFMLLYGYIFHIKADQMLPVPETEACTSTVESEVPGCDMDTEGDGRQHQITSSDKSTEQQANDIPQRKRPLDVRYNHFVALSEGSCC